MNGLIRYNPVFGNLASLDRVFDNLFADLKPATANGNAFAFPVDIKEDEKSYVIAADLPGVKKDDIAVEIDGDVVTISAEVKRETEVKEGTRVLRTERTYGKALRRFQLGQTVDEGKAEAKYVDGVLTLTLPKQVDAQTKRITVQ